MFVRAGRVIDTLGGTRRALDLVMPILPHLCHESLYNLWPVAYVKRYRHYLDQQEDRPRIVTAKEFVATTEARMLLASIKEEFVLSLAAHDEFTSSQVRALFSVNRKDTLYHWRTRGILMGNYQSAPHGEYVYSRDELRNLMRWSDELS